MKKSFAIICALLSLAACNKVTPIEENPTQKESGQEFKVNLTFSRSNISEDTKASVKTSFASGDVVFIFFNGVGDSTNPKYLEMKYNGSTWVPTQKNDLGASDLSGAGTKKLTAIYLPYGSGYEVAYDGGFTIKDDSGNDYSGHFFSGHVEYEFTDNTLSATISLSAVPSDTAGDKLVHFDVSGFASDHTYAMYQEYMKPISLTKIAANGDVSKQVGTMGDAIPGYQDASFMSFSGVLDNSAVNKDDVDFWFSIRDTFDGMFYYRDAGTRKIIEDMYIGLGSRASKWSIATPGVFTASASGEKIIFARSNLAYFGASNHDYPWRLMKYPWSLVETGPDESPIILGEYKDFSLLAWATSGYADPTRPDMDWTPWRTINGGSKYGPAIASGEWTSDSNQWDWAIYNDIYEFGGNTPLSGWRTPTADEWINIFGRSDKYIFANATVNSVTGMMIFPDAFTLPTGIDDIVNLNGYRDYSANVYNISQWNKLEAAGVVFLPAAGCSTRATSRFTQVGSMGYYQSSTANGASQAYQMRFSAVNGQPANSAYRQSGFSVRLVRDL